MGGKVIFSKKPKTELNEIFDRDEEISKLKFLLDRYEWITLLGPRLIGKTSLALAVSNSYKRRVIYVDLVKVKSVRDVVQRLYFSLPKTFIDKVRENLETIGVKIGPVSLNFRIKPTAVFETIIKSVCNEDTILILDEVQDLKQGVNHLISVFHRLLNTCNKLSIIFTGSAIGLLKTLEEQTGEKPLAGRRPTELIIKPWDEKTAKEYLIAGLNECRVNFSEDEIEQVIRELGTLVGWLNIYGVNRCIKSREEAFKDALEECKSIAREELNNVIEGKSWRRKALRMMANGATWSEILRATQVSTQTLSNFLDRLSRLYIIRKENSTYYVYDPVYRKAIL